MFVPIGPITPQAGGPEGAAAQAPADHAAAAANYFDGPLPVGGVRGGGVRE